MASQFVKSAADDSESEGLDSSLTPHGIDGPEIEIEHEDPSPSAWIRCSPADLYFQRDYKVKHRKDRSAENVNYQQKPCLYKTND